MGQEDEFLEARITTEVGDLSLMDIAIHVTICMILLPAACQVEIAVPRSWRNAAQGGQESPWLRR